MANALCSLCKVEKEDRDFYTFHRRGRVEKTARCKLCHQIKNNESKAKHGHNWKKYRGRKEKRLAATRKWRKQNLAYDSARQRERKARKLQAIPKWADLSVISSLYKIANTSGFQVDHLVPLKHPLVCGLHCEDNLQPILASVNQAKGNRYWENM